MAKKIQGITIEIDGDTTKLNKAISSLNAPINKINGELRNLNQALKLDPQNTDLLTQKQEVLKRNIEATTDKLNQLKEAQKQFGDYNSLTDQQKESYNKLSLEIAKSENALKNMNTELKGMNKLDLSKVKDTLKKVGDVAVDVVKKMAQVTAAVSGALAGVVAAGVKSYADLEKAQKGSQRLFKDSFDIVEKNASTAYKTMGLSASQYYDQVNTYAVGLKNALGGDTKAAAELSDSILKAQADIVASTGADADAVSNAFSAVMRGNYSLIDNLRLGIKGSKEGMQEVIDKVNEWNKKQGNATKYQMGNYADMQRALVDYVKMTGVAGTAQDQMSQTISGSLTQVKGALENFLSGAGSAEQLAEVFTNLATNIAKAVMDLAPHILTGLTTLIETIIPQIASLLVTLIPQLLRAITSMIDKLFDMVSKNTAAISKAVKQMITYFVAFLTNNLPTIIEMGLVLITALATGIADSLPNLIPTIVDLVLNIVDTIIDNLPMILEAALQLIIALTIGIFNALPRLLERLPELITKLVVTLTKPENLAMMIGAALTLILELAKGIIKAIPELLAAVPKLVTSLRENLTKTLKETDWKKLGTDVLNGIVNGLVSFGNTIKNAAKKIYSEIKSKIVDKFKIGSPSKVMRDEVGQWITRGIGVGIEKGIPQTIKDVNAAMTDLNNGIQSSLNPVINPTANSNPLIIQIENFNNTRNQDVQALAEELEFYRKNSALARGGN